MHPKAVLFDAYGTLFDVYSVGLLADLKDTIHSWDIAGRRLDKPLLFEITHQ